MKSRLSSLALHPTHWLVASLVAAGVILVAMGASLITTVVGGALVALSVGGTAYGVTRSLQTARRDLQQQLAERTDALSQTLVQLQAERTAIGTCWKPSVRSSTASRTASSSSIAPERS
jgi:hypothetical protein